MNVEEALTRADRFDPVAVDKSYHSSSSRPSAGSSTWDVKALLVLAAEVRRLSEGETLTFEMMCVLAGAVTAVRWYRTGAEPSVALESLAKVVDAYTESK